ncbi:MAG: LysM peptidoglycan-binding domain-containing protein [Akkermansiaceae bacterium]|nr:LysM peptidoglycan-binding domain-containing protein [Armatimonadota bacterium]
MAIVMSNGDGTFRAQTEEQKRAWTLSKRRCLQLVAAGQGTAAVVAMFAIGMTAWTGIRSVTKQSDNVVMNPVVPMSVGQGETLWTLARRYGNPSASQLDRVDTLAQANGLSASAMLHPGQRLVIPVENPREAALLQTTLAKR